MIDPVDRSLNSTAAALLGFLHAGPATGWDLLQTAQQRIGSFWTVTQSQVYRELTAMTGRGLVTPGESGPRGRVAYALTDEGRAAFAGWLDDGPGADTLRIPLLLTLTFADQLDTGRLRAVLDEQRSRHEELLAGYRSVLAGPIADRTQRATLEYGVRHEQAVLDWFAVLPEVLRLT